MKRTVVTSICSSNQAAGRLRRSAKFFNNFNIGLRSKFNHLAENGGSGEDRERQS